MIPIRVQFRSDSDLYERVQQAAEAECGLRHPDMLPSPGPAWRNACAEIEQEIFKRLATWLDGDNVVLLFDLDKVEANVVLNTAEERLATSKRNSPTTS